MTFLRNPLVCVWAILAVITIAAWWISSGTAYTLNQGVTASVLVIAGIKTYFVMAYFMEVRIAPSWLKQTMYGWLSLLVALLLLVYFCF